MYFPKASISLNIAETTFVISAIKTFVKRGGKEYQISDEFSSSLFLLANDCKSMWSEDDWEVYRYMYHLKDFSQKWKVDRNEIFTISILDCDAIMLALQFAYVVESKQAIHGDESAEKRAESIKDVLLPRFGNMFSKNEWNFYFSEVDSYEDDTIEMRAID